MKEYRLEIGNSNTGKIGAVAYIFANNREHALHLFTTGYHDTNESGSVLNNGVKGQIYFNPKNITVRDITRADS